MDGDDSLDGRPGISAQKREATNCLLKSRGFGGLLLSCYYYYHTLTSIVGSGYLCGSVPLSLSHSRSVQSSVMSRKLTTLATMFLDSGTVNQQQNYF